MFYKKNFKKPLKWPPKRCSSNNFSFLAAAEQVICRTPPMAASDMTKRIKNDLIGYLKTIKNSADWIGFSHDCAGKSWNFFSRQNGQENFPVRKQKYQTAHAQVIIFPFPSLNGRDLRFKIKIIKFRITETLHHNGRY